MEKKKIESENNVIVYIKMFEEGSIEYECVGVLMEDEEDYVRVAFSSQNNTVKDDLIIKRDKIIEIKVIDEDKINKIE